VTRSGAKYGVGWSPERQRNKGGDLGISGVMIPGVSTVHVVKSRAGASMMPNKGTSGYDPVTRTPGSSHSGGGEGVRGDVLSDGI